MEAVHNAVVLEEVAMMAWNTEVLTNHTLNYAKRINRKAFYEKAWTKCLLWTIN